MRVLRWSVPGAMPGGFAVVIVGLKEFGRLRWAGFLL